MRESFSYLIVGLLGFMAGIPANNIYVNRSAKMQTKFSVGTCLSNGLYYEKITAIQKGSVIREARYVLDSYIKGKRSAPGVTAAWIVDEDYVAVADINCKVKE